MTGFRAVGRYVQRPGAVEAFGDHLAPIDASRALVAGGRTALSTVESALVDGLAAADVAHAGTVAGIDASTDERMAAVASRAEAEACDLVVGVGGCTAIDAVKAGAERAGTSFVAVPTVASADGPAGGLAVVYDDAGRPVDLERCAANPELVLVDTSVVAEAPVRFLRWGLGDAVSTRFEAEACALTGATTIHDLETADAGLELARRTDDVLAARGAQALADVERDAVTPAVEAVVEAIHLTSVLGWENGGLAGAHALETGLRASGITGPPHGPLVALCTLAELEWRDHDDRAALAALLGEFGLGDPLADDADLLAGAEVACALPMMDNEPVDVTPSLAVDALAAARGRLDGAV